jgi:CheY-like chemotaxis protein
VAKAERPSAVILDLLMPEMDGFEFLVRFRNAAENLQVPVIVWTMKDLTFDDRSRLQRVAQAVLGKDAENSLIEQLRVLLPPFTDVQQENAIEQSIG